MPVFVQRHTTHGSEFIVPACRIGYISGFRLLSLRFKRLLQRLPAPLCIKPFRINQLKSVFCSKLFGSPAREHHMRRFFHHSSCQLYRIFHRGDATNSTCLSGKAVHHAGIQLILALMGEYGSSSGVEKRTVFQINNGLLYSIKRRTAVFKNILSDGKRRVERSGIGCLLFRRHVRLRYGTGTAVNSQTVRSPGLFVGTGFFTATGRV